MDWSTSKVSRLTHLWNEGATAAHIMADIGAPSRNSVIGKAHRLDLPRRPSPLTRSGQAAYRKRVAEGFLDVVALAAGSESDAWQAATQGLVWSGAARAMNELRDGCKWPIGDPRDDGFSYCGCPRHPSMVYCKAHAGLSARPVEARRRTIPYQGSRARAA